MPKSNVAIIGRPTQSVTLYSQMIGRVMRGKKAGGNNECKIIASQRSYLWLQRYE